MSKPRRVHLLETTLRDGGYEIDHQVTADDTAILVAALDGAGLSYIELCHGNGVGISAWAPQHRSRLRAAASDEQHLAAARAVAPRARCGVLLVVGPEFTQPSAIDGLAAQGVSFVRLGLPPDVFLDHAFWLPYVDRIKSAGMIASINLMQTAVVSVKDVVAGSVAAAAHGADWFYVVDSFGGMRPADIREYITAIGDASGLVTGLHAHNNSGLAVSNSLAAIEAGAGFVDGTLQGIGRATGNPPTEILLLALQAMGHETGVDLEAVLALGDLSRALVAEKGNDPLHFVSGTAGIHSRAMPELRKVAAGKGRALRTFLLRLGAEAKAQALPTRDAFPAALVEQVASAAPVASPRAPSAALIDRLRLACVRDSGRDLRTQAEHVFVRGIRERKTSVLHLVDASQFLFDAPLPWESGDLLGISMPVHRDELVALTERLPEVVVVDPQMSGWPSLPRGASATLQLSYSGLLADAVATLAAALAGAEPVWIADTGPFDAIAAVLRLRGVQSTAEEPAGTDRIIVTAGAPGLVERLHAGDRVVTLQLGRERAAFVDRARTAGASVLLPLVGPQVAASVFAQLTAARAAAEVSRAAVPLGKLHMIPTSVAPGTGDLVVDAREAPQHVVDAAAAGAETPFEALATIRARSLLAGSAKL